MRKFINNRRKVIIIGLIICTGIFMTACGDSKKKHIKSDKSNDTIIMDSDNNKTSDENIYMGAWRITKIAGYGNVCAYSEEDMKKLVGEKVEFSKNQTIYYDMETNKFNTMEHVSYEQKSQSSMEYWGNYKVNLEEIGLVGDKVITVDGKDKNDNILVSLVTDGNKMLMNIGNVYLELSR